MTTGLDQLLIVSADFLHAPIELREKLAFRAGEPPPEALLTAAPGIHEAIWLETCDRVEAILQVEAEETALHSLADIWWRQGRLDMQDQWERCCFYRGGGAMRHWAGVLCGLDTAFAGSPFLRYDFERALERARKVGSLGPNLRHWANQLLAFTEGSDADAAYYALRHLSTNVAPASETAAVVLAAESVARKYFGLLEGRRVLVVGAGVLGTALVQAMAAASACLAIADRDGHAAQALADSLQARHVDEAEVMDELCHSDLLITAVAGQGRVFSAADLAQAGKKLLLRSRLALDLSFPRAIDPEAAEWGISLFNVDQIAQSWRTSKAERAIERQCLILERRVERLMGAEESGGAALLLPK